MSAEPVKYITKVEIQGLFGRYDIEWNLHPDVNVLAGINGSGKSTILNTIGRLLSDGTMQYLCLEKINLSFDSGELLSSKRIFVSDQVKNIKKKAIEGDEISKHILDSINKNYSPPDSIIQFNGGKTVTQSEIGLDKLLSNITLNVIKTFDTELKPSEAVQKLSDDRVKSELDWEVYQLQEKYKDYQINIGRKKETVFKDNQGNPFYDNVVIEFRKLSYPQERLLEIIDELFLETNKKVNRDKNELEFLLGDKEINAYQLSSGEKQLLIILLTVLVQDNKPAILLMDEPEISLHMKWQHHLISYIRELNPNVQIILATHSPDIIMDGWMDKVFNMCDIAKDSQ